MDEGFFHIELKSPSEYDYINGRVKILETYLFSKEAIQRLVSLSFDELVNELLNSHYKEHMQGSKFIDVIKGISTFNNKTLLEMEKFVSPGFINSFFRSKEFFLKLKRLAIEGGAFDIADNEIKSLIKTTSNKDHTGIFSTAYKKLTENRDDILKVNLIIDIYYIQFLLLSALETKSDFIKGYYDIYASLNTELILRRFLNLIKQNIVDEIFFNNAIVMMKELFPDLDFFKKIFAAKNFEDFEEFLRSEEMHYGVNEMFKSQPDIFVRKKLEDYLDNGKFITVGIEPVFIYISKLCFESELLKKILHAKNINFESQEILKVIGYNYE